MTSLGLSTTAFPAISAGIASPKQRLSGKFQGPMTPTTPRGRRRTTIRLPIRNGEWGRMRSSARCLGPRFAQKPSESQMKDQSPTMASSRVFPVSSMIVRSIRSRFSTIHARASYMTSARPLKPSASQAG